MGLSLPCSDSSQDFSSELIGGFQTVFLGNLVNRYQLEFYIRKAVFCYVSSPYTEREIRMIGYRR